MTGWKGVVTDKPIAANLDKVAIQIQTGKEAGWVEIKVVRDREATIKWSTGTESSNIFQIEGSTAECEEESSKGYEWVNTTYSETSNPGLD